MLFILKIPTKFSVILQSFRQNQHPEHDQDHDFTFNFITKATFYTYKNPTKFCFNPMTPSKVFLFTDDTYRQTDKRIFSFFFCVLGHPNMNVISIKRRGLISSINYNTFSFYKLRMWWESKNQFDMNRKRSTTVQK